MVDALKLKQPSSTSLFCLTPPHDEGTTFVAVEHELLGDELVFRYIRPPTLLDVQPHLISAAGLNSVTVKGSGFASDMSCRLGNEVFPADPLDKEHISCAISSGRVGSFSLQVLVGNSVASNSLVMTVIDMPSVIAISPSGAPSRGGTAITVRGSVTNFGPVQCFFGGLRVDAFILTKSLIGCTSPLHVAQTVKFYISDRASHKSQAFNFTFFSDISILSIHPTQGAYLGGVTVSVTSTHVDPDTCNSTCRFGPSLGLRGTAVSSSLILCMSPPLPVGSLVKVHISCNGIDWVESGAYFEYDQPPFVIAVHPSFGKLSGGMEVTIHGQNFRDTEEFACIFGRTRKIKMRWQSQ
jgi:hypothetical protein